jgi:adenylate kinase
LPVVMDGHFTLPLRTARMAIPVEIFRALAPQVLVVLSVPPEEIRQRMVGRDGDAPQTAVLADATVAEERAAQAVAGALAVPLHRWPAEPSTISALCGLIEGLRE